LTNLFLFFKKTYKIIVVLIFLVVFFVIYNVYLVDRSIVNLRVALNQVSAAQTTEDIKKIKSLLKIPLIKEILSKKISPQLLTGQEFADNIAGAPILKEQKEDIIFFLKSAIEAKEKERGAVLSFFDRLNTLIYKPQTEIPKATLEAQLKPLLARAELVKEKDKLQEIYYDLLGIYIQLSDLSKSEESLKKLVSLDPVSKLATKAKFNFAWFLKKIGEFDKAVGLFEELSKVEELEIKSTSLYQIADTLYKKQDFNAARLKYAQFAKEFPKFKETAQALYQKGLISLEELKALESNLQYFYEFSLTQAGYISFYNLGDTDAASNYFAELEKTSPKAKMTKHVTSKVKPVMGSVYRSRCFDLLGKGQCAETVEKLKKVVEIAPLDGRSYAGLGLAHLCLNQSKEALSNIKKALEVAPKDEVVLINAMYIYINLAQIDEAIRIGEEFLSRRPFKMTESAYNLSYAYLANDNVKDAVRQLDISIKIDAKFVSSLNNKGCALWSLKKFDEAIKGFKNAVALKPDYLEPHFNMGVVNFILKRFEDAYKEFKKVLELKPGHKESLQYIERIKQQLGYDPAAPLGEEATP
jgi:tetratricopeptide (TPR) repeat protein